MTTFTISTCLRAAFKEPKGTRVKVWAPIIATAIIVAIIVCITQLAIGKPHLGESGSALYYIIGLIQSIIIIPLVTGTFMVAVLSQRHSSSNTIKITTGFQYYPFIAPLSVLAVINALLGFILQHIMLSSRNHGGAFFIMLCSILVLMSIGFFIIMASLLITEQQNGAFTALKLACQKLLSSHHFFSLFIANFIYLVYVVCCFIPLFIGLVVHLLIPGAAGWIVLLVLALASIVWTVYALPGFYHLIGHAYLKLFPDNQAPASITE